ncbi:MAG: polyphosphate polymerase domain-containing protein [Clostridia bacterium]|nr:polyphosphate polymerase domain-containing protein [Clostridia bacterium]
MNLKLKPNAKGYRHELKYVISDADAELLAIRLNAAMKPDPYAQKTGGGYHIRSLYFDDAYDAAVSEKVAGVQYRDKWRIRIYNFSDRVIKLERKHKNGQFIKKDSLSLTRNQAEALIAGEFTFLMHLNSPFAKEAYAALRTEGLRPKVLVDYYRQPFVFPLEDVRITLDRNIRTGYLCTDLFDPHAITFPATELIGQCVLEVKYNNFLDPYVAELIQLPASLKTAASKYLFCRQYDC